MRLTVTGKDRNPWPWPTSHRAHRKHACDRRGCSGVATGAEDLIYVVVWTFQDSAAGSRGSIARPDREHAGGQPPHGAGRTPCPALRGGDRDCRVRPWLLLG